MTKKLPTIVGFPYGAVEADFAVVEEICEWQAAGDSLSALEALGEYGHRRAQAALQIRRYTEIREDVLREFEALAGEFAKSAEHLQTANVNDTQYNSMADVYRGCADDVRACAARLRGTP